MINMNDTLTLFWSQIVNIPCKICNSLNSHFHLPLLCYLRLVASPLHNISFPYIIRISMRICYRKYIDKFKTLYFFISIISLERSRSKKKKKKKVRIKMSMCANTHTPTHMHLMHKSNIFDGYNKKKKTKSSKINID